MDCAKDQAGLFPPTTLGTDQMIADGLTKGLGGMKYADRFRLLSRWDKDNQPRGSSFSPIVSPTKSLFRVAARPSGVPSVEDSKWPFVAATQPRNLRNYRTVFDELPYLRDLLARRCNKRIRGESTVQRARSCW